MLFKVLDRVTLLSILPEAGDFVTLKIVRQLREDLSFTEEEISFLKIKTADGRITWDATNDSGRAVTIGEKATDIIVAALEKLNTEKKLTNQHFELYDAFVMRGT